MIGALRNVFLLPRQQPANLHTISHGLGGECLLPFVLLLMPAHVSKVESDMIAANRHSQFL
jgi:hypothetical protein